MLKIIKMRNKLRQNIYEFKRFVISVTRLGNLLDSGPLFKDFSTINYPKSPTFVGNFCRGVKIYHFSSEIIFGQIL